MRELHGGLRHIFSGLAGVNWDEAPPEMGFELSYRDLIETIRLLCRGILDSASPDPSDCMRLYCSIPAIVNVALNYKICVEHGLPLHPTRYYRIEEAGRFGLNYGEDTLGAAQNLYLTALATARGCIALVPDIDERLQDFLELVPKAVLSFTYTSAPDAYTWRASEPDKLERLTATVSRSMAPALLVGAAHGAIMPGLVLAELLGARAYFIRFSMFKRQDREPVLGESDLKTLAAYSEKAVLLFDEDVAKGTTLDLFVKRLGPLFQEYRSAAVLRHASASFRPDFTAKTWWD